MTGVVFPHGRAAVLAAAINLPAKSRSPGSCLAVAARIRPASSPRERSTGRAAPDGRSLSSSHSIRSRRQLKSRFTRPGAAGGSGRSAASALARAPIREHPRDVPAMPAGVGGPVQTTARFSPRGDGDGDGPASHIDAGEDYVGGPACASSRLSNSFSSLPGLK